MPTHSNPAINALLQDYTLTGTTGVAASVGYTFDHTKSRYSGTPDLNNASAVALDSAQQSALTGGMSAWAAVAQVSFSLDNSTPFLVAAEAQLGSRLGTTITAGISDGQPDLADLFIDAEESGFSAGESGYATAVHELGHVLSLDEGSNFTMDESVMSYTFGVNTSSSRQPSTPMIYDIAAAQYLYGENANYRSTSTNYDGTIITGASKAWTIWDAGGAADTIDASAQTGSVTLDLRGGVDEYGHARFSSVGNERFAIAFDSGNASGVVDIEKGYGGSGADIITGGYVANELKGNGGDDFLYGQEGNDSVYGGDGNDFIADQAGGLVIDPGNDYIEGGAGVDTIYAGKGNDTILGGDDADIIVDIFGGNDSIDGGDGNEMLDGGDGQDTVLGGAGNDTIHGDGDATADSLVGGDGDDLIYMGAGDTVFGGAGNDTIVMMDDGSTAWSYIEASNGADKIIVVNPFTARGTISEGDDAGDSIWFGDQDLTSWYTADMTDGWENFGYNLPEGFVIYKGEWADPWALYSSTNPGYLEFWNIFDWQYGTSGPPTLSSVDNYTGSEVSAGTSGADTITGGSSADVISGGAGDDSLSGAGGNDRISAAMGNDYLSGGSGDDMLQSDDLGDTVGGADTVSGGDGNDYIETGGGNDSINAGEGRDTARAAAGNDTLRGYGGDDWLDGGDGDDRFYGGLNNDTVNGGAGADTVNGEEGNDFIQGKDGSDLLYGDDGNDAAYGDDGNDRAYGGNGLDRLYGWTGNDSLWGEADADLIVGDAGLDSLDGGTGNDTIYGGDDHDEILGGDGDDQLFADAGNDSVTGGNGHDLIYGWTGNDTIDGQAGNDTISGEDGSDSLTGYTGDDVIFGGAGNDSLLGASGNDYSEGGDGNDYISSYNDNDTIIGGGGQDTLTSGAGLDIFIFKAVSDSYQTGSTQVLDRITDFTLDSDKIDVSLLGYTGIQAGSGSGTTLGFVYSSATDRTYVSAANSDFKFYLTGNYTLDADDFTFA